MYSVSIQSLAALIIFACSSNFDLFAQKADVIQHHIVGLDIINPKPKSPQKAHIKSIYNILTHLGEMEAEEKRFNGEFSFSFNGDDGLAQKMFVFGAGLKLQKGTFPGEFNFSYNSGLTISNNRINENISNIFASYDYHPNFSKDRLGHEFFGFINRFSDAYLSVDLRYELGGGYILQAWSKNKLVSNGKARNDSINLIDFNGNTLQVKIHFESLKKHYSDNKLSSAYAGDVDKLKSLQQNMTNYNIKKYARFRTGLLVGLFFEFERVILKDSLKTNGLKQKIDKPFDPTHKIRYELRPFFQWRLTNGIQFNWETYFKMPMFGHERNIVVSSNNQQTSDLRDIRVDSEASLTMKLVTPDVHEKEVAISLIYNHFYDEAPQRYFTEFLDSNGLQILHSASRHHHQFRMKFGIQF